MLGSFFLWVSFLDFCEIFLNGFVHEKEKYESNGGEAKGKLL